MSNIKKGKQELVIPKNLVNILSQEEKENMLKKEVVDTFSTVSARNERARKNKWLRWKYFDDLNNEHDWLSDHIIEDMGWAIGRRIYDKEEILTLKGVYVFQNAPINKNASHVLTH